MIQRLIFVSLFVAVASCGSFGQTQTSWISIGPYGGDLGQIAVDPFNSAHIVVFTLDRTAYKTSDGGEHWQMLDWKGFEEFQFDPVRQNCLYTLLKNNNYSPPEYRFLKSTDQGLSWSVKLQGDAVLSGLRVASVGGSRIYLVREFQMDYKSDSVEVLCSTDTGESWNQIYRDTDSIDNSNRPRFVVPFPQDTLRLLLVKQGGVDSTADGGQTWNPIDSVYLNGTSYAIRGVGVQDLVINPQKTMLWFARFSYWWTSDFIRSTDGGVHWTSITDVRVPNDNGPIFYPPIPNNSTSIRFHSLHPDTMFIAVSAGSTFLYRSTDSGESWSRSADSLTTDEVQDLVYVDDAYGMFLSTKYNIGLYKVTPTSLKFVPSNHGINLLSFNSVNAPSGMNGSIISAGQPYGIFVSTDGGMTWDMRQHGLPRQSVTRLIVHPLVPRFQYALGDMMYPGNNLCRTTDAGLSWSTIGVADDIDVSPIDTLVLFRSKGEIYSEGIEKSTDGGNTWAIKFPASPLNPRMPSQFMRSRKVVTHKFNPNIIFGVVLRKYEDMNLPRVFRSMDAGETWDSLGLPRSILNGIYGIWFDPESPSRMYLSHDWGFITSSDNGSSWSTLSIPTLGVQILDIVDLIVTPGQNTQLFAATSRGVFRSLDRGQSWHMIGDSTVEFPVVSLALDQNNILYAASSNSGIYKTSNPVTTVKRDMNTMPAVLSLKQNYPNPFNPSTIISFDLPSKGFVWLKVFNLLGQEVATLVSEELTSGNHSRQWNAEGLSSGVYLYRLQVGSFIQTKKLVLLK